MLLEQDFRNLDNFSGVLFAVTGRWDDFLLEPGIGGPVEKCDRLLPRADFLDEMLDHVEYWEFDC